MYFDEPAADKREAAVWAYISTAFSEPVARVDDQADYAPTQVIAELFKGMGLDGIAYRSAFGEDGYNVAIFNPSDGEITGCWVYQVAKIKHDVQIDRVADRWLSQSFVLPKTPGTFPLAS